MPRIYNKPHISYLYNHNIGKAKLKGIEFKLTKDEYKDLVLANCHYCNTSPINLCFPKKFKEGLYYNGIDRKDSDIGYLIDNSVTCCYICNRAKMKLSYERFLQYLRQVANNVR